jgi:quercetin dioxygenase-like cupin family protein
MASARMALESIRSINWSSLPQTPVNEAIGRREFHTETLTVIRYDFEAGGVFPRHAHPESQLTLIVSGRFTFDFGDRREAYAAGELVSIAGGVPHEGRADDGPAVVLCFFAPPRGPRAT